MSRRYALLVTALALLISLPGSAAAGGPVVIGRGPMHHHPFNVGTPFFFPSGVVAEPVPVAVPVLVAVPVPVVIPALPPAEAAPPPPPPPDEPTRRPIVANPGPKIIDISPPAPGAKTVTVTVHQGSSTVVETVPVR